jgi:hypothetical protein
MRRIAQNSLTMLLVLLGGARALASPASAAVVVVGSEELSPAQRERLELAGQQALGALTGHRLLALPEGLRRPQKACATPECFARLHQATGADLLLVLSGGMPDLDLQLHAWWVDGSGAPLTHRTATGGNPDQPSSSVRKLVDSLLPASSRKGFAALWVDAPEGSGVKVDGRLLARTPMAQPLALTAGTHELDIVLPSGHALLERQRIEEGQRLLLDPSGVLNSGLGVHQKDPFRDAVKPVSLGLWTAGAVAIAGAFVAGALARGAAGELGGCGATDRDCLRIDQARATHQRAEGHARTANALMIGGSVLGGAGAGLFVFDLLAPRGKGKQ